MLISQLNATQGRQMQCPEGISAGKTQVEGGVAFNAPTVIRAIAKIKKTCLTGRQVTVQTTALPPVYQKNLLKFAFLPLNPRKELERRNSKRALYIIQNQWIDIADISEGCLFLHPGQVITDFEFNKPISKKGARISKDFEKNTTDFERFRTDFEFGANGTAPKLNLSKW